MSVKTTILIQRTTRDKLNAAGKRGETFDEIILRLLSSAKK